MNRETETDHRGIKGIMKAVVTTKAGLEQHGKGE
jgi:hypothetical protein